MVVVLLGAVGTSYGVAVMSVDLGSEWMKIAVVSVRFFSFLLELNAYLKCKT